MLLPNLCVPSIKFGFFFFFFNSSAQLFPTFIGRFEKFQNGNHSDLLSSLSLSFSQKSVWGCLFSPLTKMSLLLTHQHGPGADQPAPNPVKTMNENEGLPSSKRSGARVPKSAKVPHSFNEPNSSFGD
jgi:hypothetical protein